MSQTYEKHDLLEGIPLKERHDFYKEPGENRNALRRARSGDMTVEEFHERTTADMFGSLAEYAEMADNILLIPEQYAEEYQDLLREYSPRDDQPDINDEDLESFRNGKKAVSDQNIGDLDEFDQVMDDLTSVLFETVNRFRTGKNGFNIFYDWGKAHEMENTYWRIRGEKHLDRYGDKQLLVD